MNISLNQTDFDTLVNGGTIEVPNSDGSQTHMLGLQDIGWSAMFLAVASAMAKKTNPLEVAVLLEATATGLRKLQAEVKPQFFTAKSTGRTSSDTPNLSNTPKRRLPDEEL
jgi:hypothetical protein